MSVKFEYPFELFSEWFKMANTALEGFSNEGSKIDCTAFVLSTVSSDGMPSSRVVLLKQFDVNGFAFFTNTESKKGVHIAQNNRVSLCFYWPHIGRQVRIEGKAVKASVEEDDKYFDSRGLESRVGATVSKQSRKLSSYDSFIESYEEKLSDVNKAGEGVKRPLYWGGYIVKPTLIEFWENEPHRLHKRDCYSLSDCGGEWEIEGLYP